MTPRARTPKIGRPRKGRHPRVKIGMRIDPDLLASLRRQAARRGVGYQMYLHDLLERAAKGEAA